MKTKYRLKKKAIIPVAALAIALAATACGNSVTNAETAAVTEAAETEMITTTISVTDTSSDATATETASSTSSVFTSRDLDPSYDENSSINISLEGSTATCGSSSVNIDGSSITINAEGTYILSGTLDDGMIVVDVDNTEKVQLVLDNADINSSTSAAIYVKQADKVFVTSEEGSTNTLSNGGSFEAIDENNIDAVIFSKDDLTLNGTGTLVIESPAGHGIVSKDSLRITGGKYEITAASHGLTGKDDVSIAYGEFNITSGEDGIHSENSDDTTLGYVYIENGTFNISAGDDGIHAYESVTVNGGTLNITDSYEGMEAIKVTINGGDITINASDDGINAAGGNDQSGFGGPGEGGFGGGFGKGGHGGFGGEMQTGIVAGNTTEISDTDALIQINGGTLSVTAYGDGLDANGSLEITGGYVKVTGPTEGDTSALDYDGAGIISGGTFLGSGSSMMAQSLTGMGQGVIAINAGNIDAGTEISVADENGNEIVSFSSELPSNVIIISDEAIVSGSNYTLNIGSESQTVTAN